MDSVEFLNRKYEIQILFKGYFHLLIAVTFLYKSLRLIKDIHKYICMYVCVHTQIHMYVSISFISISILIFY